MGCGFCESTLSNSAGTLVVDCVVKPLGRYLGYLYRYHDNKEKLKGKKDELTMAQGRLQCEIKEADNQLLLADDEKDLLSKVEKILSDIETLEEEMQVNKRCFSWCPNWSWRYQLSKKAMEKTQEAMELLEETKNFGQSRQIAYRRPAILPDIGFLCSKDLEFSKSSKEAFDQIIEALKDDNTSKIGLWGMGGVGKTTLVREVGKQAKELNLFDKVVFTTVSQKPNFEAIQDEIARYLGFDMKNERRRRSEQELWSRLKTEKRILIILDDVWADINLKEKIGIPLEEDHKGCRILLTTRRQQVCAKMDCRKVVQLCCLDDDEAWALFSKKAGLNDSSDDAIKKLANQIIKKCKGLPIAIVTLGSALKGINYHGWEATYSRLQNHRLTEIEDMSEENAYPCIEASFDYLKDKGTKKCFLLCSLFPEDYAIYVEDLVRYAWGLEFYEGNSIERVRGEVLAAMDILKKSCLLLDYGERNVKMHDMVREVALWIASSRKEISFVIKSEVAATWPKDESFEHYSAIYFKTSRIAELPEGLAFPNLKILFLDGDYFAHATASSEFFEGMKALKVCALSNMLVSLAAFQFQTNLRTLHLAWCTLSDISILGQLKTLQVLSFLWCGIIELPNEIGELENLRLLDLSDCQDLRRIPPHLIRRLSNLEELYMHGCSSLKWATENATQEENYSSLSELNSLPNLAALSLDLSSEHIPKGFVFPELKMFDVCIGIGRQRPVIFSISRSLKIEASTLNACRQLFQDIESLEMQKLVGHRNLVPSLGEFKKLTFLNLRSCEHMTCLIDASKQQIAGLRSMEQEPSHHVSLQSLKIVEIDNCNKLRYLFPMSVANSLGKLETLDIRRCSELEEIIQATEVQNISLQSLREVYVEECNKLTSLSSLSHGQRLENLTALEIRDCIRLEYTFPISMAEGLPQLKKVWLQNLPQLKGRDGNDIVLSLPSLQELKVENLPQLTSVITLAEIQVQEGLNHHVSLQSLKVVEISNCSSLQYLFPTSVANSLGKLEKLIIESCSGLEEIIQTTDVSNISLQSLKEVHVVECNSLRSLKFVEIYSCNNMKYLFPTSVANSLGQLETLKIRSCSGLEEIIQAADVSNMSLQSLREVHVVGCNNLTSLSSLSHGQRLENLRKLVIQNCYRLEYTFPFSMVEGLPQLNEVCLDNLPQCKGRDGNDIVLTLSSLQKLRVFACRQLTPFIILAEVQVQQGLNHHVSLQSLKVVEISNCNSSKYLFPTSVANSLGQLETLKVRSCSGLEEIIQAADVSNISLQSLREVHVVECNSLRSLKIVEIFSCNSMKYLFPTSVADSLGQLEALKIQSCSGLEEIIQTTDVSNISLQSLREVHVVHCNNLTSLSSLSHGQSLENLGNLGIRDCCRLEYTFPFSMIEGLPQLNEVCLDNLPQCKGRDGNDIVPTLSSLQKLQVFGCPQLTPSIILAEIQKNQIMVQQGLNRHLSFHSLKVIKIGGWDNLRYLFPMSVADSLGQLEILHIRNCLGLEEIIQETAVSETSLKSLKEVEVKGCNNLTSLSSLSHGHRLENLTTLRIIDCLRLEYTFSNSMAEGLQKLSQVCLENLPQLKGIDGNDIVLTLPSLRALTVINCPQLTPSNISAKIQDLEFGRMEERKQICNMTDPERSANMLQVTNSEGLFDSGYNLSSMWSLCLEKLPQLRVIWKGPIQAVNFQNLTRLEVGNCNRLRYIFSPIIARNLPQLSDLWIHGCEELEQIIEKDQTSSQDHLQPFCFPNLTTIDIKKCENLKCLFPITVAYCGLPKLEELNVQEVSDLERVFEEVDEANVSNDKQKVIELPQLKSLRLEKLSNLVSFSPVGCHFIFPYLFQLNVEDCPNMTTSFSVDSKKSMHAKTEATQSSDETIVEESGTSQETTWPIGSDIGWRRWIS